MAKINLTDLPKDQKISKKEMKKVKGGAILGARDFGTETSIPLVDYSTSDGVRTLKKVTK